MRKTAQLKELAAASQRLSERYARLSALFTRASLATQPEPLWKVLLEIGDASKELTDVLLEYSAKMNALEIE